MQELWDSLWYEYQFDYDVYLFNLQIRYKIKERWNTKAFQFKKTDLDEDESIFHLRVPVFDFDYKFEFQMRLRNRLNNKLFEYSQKQTIIIPTSSLPVIYNIDSMINQSEMVLYHDKKSFYPKFVFIKEKLSDNKIKIEYYDDIISTNNSF